MGQADECDTKILFVEIKTICVCAVCAVAQHSSSHPECFSLIFNFNATSFSENY